MKPKSKTKAVQRRDLRQRGSKSKPGHVTRAMRRKADAAFMKGLAR